MRKFIPLTLIALCCYCFLQAQQSKTVDIPNFGKEFVKGYQPNDLYEVEIVRSDKVGYALQVASLSSYESVVRYVTELQGKWFSNVLMKLDQTATGAPVYKILLGPFPDRQAATAYKKSMKEEGINGFITSLSTMASGPLVKVPATPTKQTSPVTNPTGTPVTASSTTTQTGEASYYADKFHGKITASGEPFNMYAYTAAHWTLPFNTVLEVCRLDNKKCVTVKVNDRGPNPAKAIGRDGKPRILDLSLAAAEAIDLVEAGVTQVRITQVNKMPPPPIQAKQPVAEKAATTPVKEEAPIYTSKGGATSFTQSGEASYYAAKFHGRSTASGEPFDMYAYTAAHWTLPFNTLLKVCRIDNGKCVNVRVNDRGPNPAKAIGRDGKPRVIDLSLAAAEAIGLVEAGVTQVQITQVEQTPPPAVAIETARPSNTPAPYVEKGGTNFTQVGEASFYSDLFQNRQTASGELFDMYAYTAAHWTLPFNTKLKVCRLDNGKCVNVRVNDRGPNPAKAIGRDGRPRIIDLSLAAAQAIDLEMAGLAQVRIEVVD